MKNLLLTLTIVIFAALPSLSQLQGQALIDSLEAELPKAKGDTNHVKLLNKLSYQYSRVKPSEGIEYGEKGVVLAKDIDWKKGESSCYYQLGINYLNKSDFTKALENYHMSLEIKKELQDSIGIANTIGNIGTVYLSKSEYSKALEYLLKSLQLKEEFEDMAGIARTLNNIGLIYHRMSNNKKALEYYSRSLEIKEKIGLKTASTLHNIGNIYSKEDSLEKALKYINLAKAINEGKNGSKMMLSNNLSVLGVIYKKLKEYEKAIRYNEEALSIKKEIEDKDGTALIIGNMGEIYLAQAEDIETGNRDGVDYSILNRNYYIDKSIEYFSNSIKLDEKLGNLQSQIFKYEGLSKAYKLKGNFEKVLELSNKHHSIKDSVFSKENQDKINSLTAERDKIEAEKIASEEARIITEKKAQRNRLQYLGIGAVVVAFGVLLLLSGRMKLSEWVARALVFLTFIFLFEFILVIIDPWTDEYSEGIPIIKFGINMCLALVIFPMHQYFEHRVSLKVVKPDSMSNEQILEEFRKRKAEEKS
ncbi:MAG: hypothetical protein Kapaf2KO_20910 [Candidatus Kapaibacteriales bacterium]